MNTRIYLLEQNTGDNFGHESIGPRYITLIHIEFQDVIEQLFWCSDLITLFNRHWHVRKWNTSTLAINLTFMSSTTCSAASPSCSRNWFWPLQPNRRCYLITKWRTQVRMRLDHSRSVRTLIGTFFWDVVLETADRTASNRKHMIRRRDIIRRYGCL